MIFSPAGAETRVPRALLERPGSATGANALARRDGQRAWNDYTPYELRSVSAFVRLGQPQRAHALLDFFLRDRPPGGWNQWAEVVGREPREPRFLGDMPHAWISSDFIRSALDLLAYERDSDRALVLGAGVPEAWLRDGPIEVQGLRTAYGKLDFPARTRRAGAAAPRRRRRDSKRRRAACGSYGPARAHRRRASVDGQPLAWQGRLLRLPDGAVDLRLRWPGDTGVR